MLKAPEVVRKLVIYISPKTKGALTLRQLGVSMRVNPQPFTASCVRKERRRPCAPIDAPRADCALTRFRSILAFHSVKEGNKRCIIIICTYISPTGGLPGIYTDLIVTGER